MRILAIAAVAIGVSALVPLSSRADSIPAQPVVIDSSQHIADRIIKSKKPVLIDFWAAWCAPCRMLNPIIKQLEKEYQGKVTFMKVNIDIHRNIASYFGVRSIPAIFIVHDKTVVKSIPGLREKEVYAEALNEVLASAASAAKAAAAPADTTKNE